MKAPKEFRFYSKKYIFLLTLENKKCSSYPTLEIFNKRTLRPVSIEDYKNRKKKKRRSEYPPF